MNTIALLIPVYRNPAGLKRSLEELPTDIPLDVVVVDDGSEPAISLEGITCPFPVHLLRMEQNGGIDYALNHGLQWILERGYDYVARLDAEDIALPGRFLEQFRFLEANRQHALIGGQVRYVDLEGKEVFQESLPLSHDEIWRTMRVRNCFVHPAVMIRTSALRSSGIYSHDFASAEDFELFFRLMLAHSVANLEAYVVVCCLNPAGISAQRRHEQMVSRIRIMARYFDPAIGLSYFGLFKNVAMFALPKGVITLVKRRLGNNRSIWT